MERKIGEIFGYNGEWYQCVEVNDDANCSNCDIQGYCIIVKPNGFGRCLQWRSDNKLAIFKKLEKVGEPFERNGYMYQEYKAHTYPLLMSGGAKIPTYNGFAVIIKQNKEDMEEEKIQHYDCFFNMKSSELNLKPFSLEAAKAGKPVCTRDGRKARIVCFDAKDTQPIIGLYEKNIDGIVREYLCSYHTDGRMYDDQDTGYDLMMLTEKKEGWVNVYYDRIDRITFSKHPYPSKEEAIKNVGTMSNRIDTVKIFWEE